MSEELTDIHPRWHSHEEWHENIKRQSEALLGLTEQYASACSTIDELQKRIGELEAERDEARNRNSAHPSSSGNEPERDDKK